MRQLRHGQKSLCWTGEQLRQSVPARPMAKSRVGYYCSQPATCGQVCISSGVCELNKNSCTLCVGTICQKGVACGGQCGSSDWCAPSCPVCNNVAKCAASEEYPYLAKQDRFARAHVMMQKAGPRAADDGSLFARGGMDADGQDACEGKEGNNNWMIIAAVTELGRNHRTHTHSRQQKVSAVSKFQNLNFIAALKGLICFGECRWSACRVLCVRVCAGQKMEKKRRRRQSVCTCAAGASWSFRA